MLIRRSACALAVLLALILSACGTSALPTAQAPTSAPTAIPANAAPTAVPATATPTEAPPTAAPTSATTGITVTDVAGRTVTIAATPERLISLAPSTTEILFALGLGSKIVAADDFSDFPAEAKNLPKIGGPNRGYNFQQNGAPKPHLTFPPRITAPQANKHVRSLQP